MSTPGPNMVRQMIGFRVGPEDFAIDISKIHEIIKPLPITVMPNIPSGFSGVIQLRDQVIVIADLHAQFCFSRAEETKETRIIVLEGRNRRIGIVVDAVSEVVRFSPDMVDPSPGFHNGISPDFINGIGKLNGTLLTLLDVDAIFPDQSRPEEDDFGAISDGITNVEADATPPSPEVSTEVMEELGKKAESGTGLYRDLGELARYINMAHQQFADGVTEGSSINVKARDIPTAYEMLDSVTNETETATMQIMSHTEETGHSVGEIRAILEQIEEAVPASHEAAAKIGDLADKMRQECSSIEAIQDDTMMTMSFQDLTGQKIKQVVVLMSEVEERILKLVVEFGVSQAAETEEAIEEAIEEKMHVLKDDDHAGVNQDGVDDILAGFGF